jgi:hypothetical protein
MYNGTSMVLEYLHVCRPSVHVYKSQKRTTGTYIRMPCAREHSHLRRFLNQATKAIQPCYHAEHTSAGAGRIQRLALIRMTPPGPASTKVSGDTSHVDGEAGHGRVRTGPQPHPLDEKCVAYNPFNRLTFHFLRRIFDVRAACVGRTCVFQRSAPAARC